MTNYVIGTPGNPPRMTMQGSATIALSQAKSGEVCFAQATLPAPPFAINADGTELVAVAANTDLVTAMKWDAIRIKRNALRNDSSWSIADDTPLSDACRADWLIYLKKLQSITDDFTDPDAVIWPEKPGIEYPS